MPDPAGQLHIGDAAVLLQFLENLSVDGVESGGHSRLRGAFMSHALSSCIKPSCGLHETLLLGIGNKIPFGQHYCTTLWHSDLHILHSSQEAINCPRHPDALSDRPSPKRQTSRPKGLPGKEALRPKGLETSRKLNRVFLDGQDHPCQGRHHRFRPGRLYRRDLCRARHAGADPDPGHRSRAASSRSPPTWRTIPASPTSSRAPG